MARHFLFHSLAWRRDETEWSPSLWFRSVSSVRLLPTLKIHRKSHSTWCFVSSDFRHCDTISECVVQIIRPTRSSNPHPDFIFNFQSLDAATLGLGHSALFRNSPDWPYHGAGESFPKWWWWRQQLFVGGYCGSTDWLHREVLRKIELTLWNEISHLLLPISRPTPIQFRINIWSSIFSLPCRFV